MTHSTIAERLATFAAELDVDKLPDAVRERAKACLIHAIVVGIAGSAADFGQQAEQASDGSIEQPDARGYARSLVTGHWHPAAAAAFINGVHLHARAQEDTHGTFHPGVSVIPAALAAAESGHVDGKTFLAAVTAGYEVGIALSAPLTELTTPPFRATAVFGPVAAAAAVGRILGLDAERMRSALSIAASMAGGTSESFGAGTDEWHFQAGAAAATGMMAAQLAEAKVTGSRTAFEADAGYLQCFARSGLSADTIAGDLGTTWNILGVTFKPYPVCAFNQAPAMLGVRLRTSVAAEHVASIRLRMNEREATYPGMRWIHVFLDNARYHHAKLVQAWLAQPGRRIKLHFIPAYCPHLNPIERLWGLMHRHTTHNKCYSSFKDFSIAMLNFVRDDVPRNWRTYCDEVTDN